ncbi:MAG: ATP-dependent Clp protease proteolytic subunit, partial [Pseudomonadota bacterium]
MPFIPRFDDEEDEEKVKAQQSIPVDKHLFEARQVMIVGPITMDLARDVCQRLLALAHVSSDPITVIVSSPGGHVESGDMIH